MADAHSDAPFLQHLNPAQRQAVETIEGPVMVVAGPGTGKTQVLAARIAHILNSTDTAPGSILALSFTDAAVKNLRQRLVQMVGSTAYKVQVHTFHSFCTEVITTHSELFPLDRDSQPLTELERYAVVEELLNQHTLKVLKPLNRPYHYTKDILKAISDLKREGVTVERFDELVAAFTADVEQQQTELKKTALTKLQAQLAKNQELLVVYAAYQQRLQELKRFDFDDMVTMVVAAWQEHPDLLAEYQEQILYLLVDEYQDTNSAQNQLTQLWASFWQEEANLCVVGDPHQAIYRFQGASVENVLHFMDVFPTATVVTLTQGYRSPQPIYQAAATLIAANDTKVAHSELQSALNTTLQSQHHHSPLVLPAALVQYVAPNQITELLVVADRVKALITAGVKAEEIAILYRHNADAEQLVAALAHQQIKAEIDGGNNVLEEYHIQQLLELLRQLQAIATGQHEALFYQVLLAPWFGLDQLVVLKIARIAQQQRLSVWQVLEQGYQAFHLKDPKLSVTEIEFAPVAAVAAQCGDWAKTAAAESLPEWLAKVIDQSQFVTWALAKPETLHLVWGWKALFELARSLVRKQPTAHLAEFLSSIDTLERHKLPLLGEDSNRIEGAVHLSSVHRAKGREWEYVFLIHCVDGKWSNTKKRETLPLAPGILAQSEVTDDHRLQDDRRLFYVAITRAKRATIITHADTEVTDGRTKQHLPTQFLSELGESVQELPKAEVTKIVDQPEQAVAELLSPQPEFIPAHQRAKDFYSGLVADISLSVSALNAYLRDPATFLTEYVLRLPRPSSPAMGFGSAVHAALEKWGKQRLEERETISLSRFLQVFEDVLAQQELSEYEFKLRREYGLALLTDYYHQELATFAGELLFVERMSGYGKGKTVLDDIVLTGRFDRVEWVDQAAGTVRIVDYKTGQPKTMGELLGTTQSSGLSAREQALPESIRSPYQRQLLFYRLLAELDATFKPTVVEGVLAFIEPDKRTAKRVERALTLSDEGVQELKKLIIEVASEIRQLAFLPAL